jgi:DNA-binding MarR family transcriptional regulator
MPSDPIESGRFAQQLIGALDIMPGILGNIPMTDPARKILLHLFAAQADDRRTSLESVRLAAGVSVSTVSRWLNRMQIAGIIRRDTSAPTGIVYVRLTELGWRRMIDALRLMHSAYRR